MQTQDYSCFVLSGLIERSGTYPRIMYNTPDQYETREEPVKWISLDVFL